MDVPELNPYRPPSPLPESGSGGGPHDSSATLSIESLLRAGPIDFSGHADFNDLEEYLRADGDLGCVFPLSLTAFTGLLLLLLIGIGGPRFIPLAFGVAGIVLIGLAVSTRAYRRALFRNRQPHWNNLISGQIRSDGLSVRADGVSTHFQWKGLIGIELTEHLIAVEPVIPKGRVILLTPSMMHRLDAWSATSKVFRLWSLEQKHSADSEAKSVSRRILRDATRARIVDPPTGAIAMSGPIHTTDFANVAGQRCRRVRPIRTHVVRLTMLVLVVGTCFESARLLLPDAKLWQLIVAAYAVAGLFWFVMLSKRGSKRSRLLHHIHGYVGSDGITTDLGIVTDHIPWSAMTCFDRSSEHITLARRDGWQWLHLKRSMVANDNDWKNALDMIASGINV